MTAALFVLLAFSAQLESGSSFVGTWELVALSQTGRPRPGQGRLLVAPGPPVRPRPAHLPPVPKTRVLPMLVHYGPARIDLEDSTKNSTEAGAPDSSSPEFTIHQAFAVVPVMPPPAAREDFFAEILRAPEHHQGRWDAVIVSAEPEGEAIRAEILVWPLVSVLERSGFRAVPVRPFLETWIHEDGHLNFVSGEPASTPN